MGLPSLASEIPQSGREGKGGVLGDYPNPAGLPLDQTGAAGGAAAPAGPSGPGIHPRAGTPHPIPSAAGTGVPLAGQYRGPSCGPIPGSGVPLAQAPPRPGWKVESNPHLPFM